MISSIIIKVATYSNCRLVSHGCEWKGEGNDLDNEQLLANNNPHSLLRSLYCAHGQNVHVNRQADSDQEIAVNDRESLFDRSTSQAHANPPVRNPLASIADLLTERREIRLDQPSEYTVKTFFQEGIRWCLGRSCSAGFKGRDELSEPTLGEGSQIQAMLILGCLGSEHGLDDVYGESTHRRGQCFSYISDTIFAQEKAEESSIGDPLKGSK
jgi:hypothetical protein